MSSSKKNIRTAAIVAAGSGSRLRKVIGDMPKGFLRLDGVPIIEQSISKLLGRGIEKIIIGTGYGSMLYEELAARAGNMVCVKNTRYESTGSMATLAGMRDFLKEDFLLLESDLIYEGRCLDILLEDEHRDVILSSSETRSGDEVFLEVDAAGNLAGLSKDRLKLKNIHSELVGISVLSPDALSKMCASSEAYPMSDYEHAMARISRQTPIFVRREEGLAWTEIDDEAHLRRALDLVYPRIKRRDAA